MRLPWGSDENRGLASAAYAVVVVVGCVFILYSGRAFFFPCSLR